MSISEETKARRNPRNPNGMPISKCARCAGDIICELLTEQQWQALCDNLHKPHIKIAFMEKIWWHLDGDKGCCGHEDPLLDLDSPEREGN